MHFYHIHTASTQPRHHWLGLFLYITLLLNLSACALLPNDETTREAEAQALLSRATEQEVAGDTEAAVRTLQEINALYGATEAAAVARQNSSRLLLTQAEAHRTAGAYEAALQAYGGITDPARLEDADTAVAEIYQAWVQELLEQGDYDTAVTQLETLEIIRGDDPADQQEINHLRTQLALAQGQAELAAGNIPAAYVNYMVILTQEPATVGADRYDTAVSTFRQNVAPPLFTYAQERATAEDYSQATLAFEAIAQYGPPDLIPAAQTEAAAVTLRWGEALLAAQDYPGAIEKFAYLRAFYPDSDVAAPATAGWVDAQVAQIQASGLAGELPPLQASEGTDNIEDNGTAVYRVQNDTPCPVIILLSGPNSQLLRLSPTASGETTLTAGAYTAVVQPDSEADLNLTCRDIAPFLGQYDLASGTIYNARFFTTAEQ